ncbi:MAG: hypothetical protein IJA36_08485 [Lachnospiraceae bacterium]|nr:hypothetical protein [Lachnospiraceae bacterium]
MVRFKILAGKIKEYGYEYSFKKYVTCLLATSGVVLGICWFMRIKSAGVLCILAGVFLLLPLVVLYQYKALYEQKKFSQAIDYMEYVIYGFMRMPKIVNALEETEKLCDDTMKRCIGKAIDRIRYADMYRDIYTDAFLNMEEEYGTERMEALHRFLIQIEQQGGEYKKSLEVLLEDIRQWADTIYLLQKERKELQRKVNISLVLSAATAITMVGFLPQEVGDIAENMLYQISSTTFVLLSFGIFVLSRKSLVRSWLKGEEVKAELEKAYEYCLKPENKKNRHYKFAVKKVENHVKKEFPVWLRNVILNMNTENVFVAMEKAAENASYVLKNELRKTLIEIEKEPGSMMAYQGFLKGFEIAEVKTVFLMFYSLNEFGTKEAEEQINSIIKRNNKLAEQSEKIRNEESLGIFGVYMLCPMVLAAAKMLLDMWVFVQQFLFYYSNVIH